MFSKIKLSLEVFICPGESQVLDQVPERIIVSTQLHSGCTPDLGVLEWASEASQ